jgi:phosphoribosylamine--glycine ligase
VLCITALGENVQAARDLAYSGVRHISWPGAFYRTDIAHRALNRGG